VTPFPFLPLPVGPRSVSGPEIDLRAIGSLPLRFSPSQKQFPRGQPPSLLPVRFFRSASFLTIDLHPPYSPPFPIALQLALNTALLWSLKNSSSLHRNVDKHQLHCNTAAIPRTGAVPLGFSRLCQLAVSPPGLTSFETVFCPLGGTICFSYRNISRPPCSHSPLFNVSRRLHPDSNRPGFFNHVSEQVPLGPDPCLVLGYLSPPPIDS